MDSRTTEEDPYQCQEEEENTTSQKTKTYIDYFVPCSWYFRMFICKISKDQGKPPAKELLAAVVRFFACTSFNFFGVTLHFLRFYTESSVCMMEDLIIAMYYISNLAFVVLFSRCHRALLVGIHNLYDCFPKPKDLDEMLRMQQKCTYYVLGGVYTAATIAMIIANLDVSDCKEKMHTPMGYRSCGFIAPMWLPFEFDHQPIRLCMVVLHYLHAEILIVLPAVFAISYSIVIHHLLRGCDTLIRLVENVDNDSKETSIRDRLVAFIKLHNKFIKSLNAYIEVWRPYLLLVVINVVIFVGFPIIDIIWMGPSLIMVTMLMCWASGVTFVMIISQQLTNKSAELSQAVYNLRWYDMDKESKSLLLFILIRTQKPMVMKTEFSTISHSTLLSAMKTTYSFTTAMLQTTRK